MELLEQIHPGKNLMKTILDISLGIVVDTLYNILYMYLYIKIFKNMSIERFFSLILLFEPWVYCRSQKHEHLKYDVNAETNEENGE